MSNEELKQNLTSSNQWLRLLYMVLFAVLLEIAGFVMLAVVIAQFLFAIFTGSANDNLRRLGDQIASYIYQTLQFLIYNSEEKPFPFSEWPESEEEDLSTYESAEEIDGEVISADDEEVVAESAESDANDDAVESAPKADASSEKKPAKRNKAAQAEAEKPEEDSVIELGGDSAQSTSEATETTAADSDDKPSGDKK
ncbi:DUF4389 domain-containing protein [Microbulbifer hydrolyticus]|uniref:DUF4389 domain-containing protein n=1 Tax=Microbulbifer hydrolyticus TaxID=48074 RepID=A0A6P1TA24_9GAMM|nr:DUF4389 domain-containing protein [Microbulbifer hydrolyticus]MBB5209827.1 hypothetical protein [Microbulbifer hydrolyticus]QHQ39628.1 DUF4389 domain-containing protein [Microbulbifer hydrolyticus]